MVGDQDIVGHQIVAGVPDVQRANESIVQDPVMPTSLRTGNDAGTTIPVNQVVGDERIREVIVQVQAVTGVVPYNVAADRQTVAAGVDAMIELDVAAVELDEVVLDQQIVPPHPQAHPAVVVEPAVAHGEVVAMEKDALAPPPNDSKPSIMSHFTPSPLGDVVVASRAEKDSLPFLF